MLVLFRPDQDFSFKILREWLDMSVRVQKEDLISLNFNFQLYYLKFVEILKYLEIKFNESLKKLQRILKNEFNKVISRDLINLIEFMYDVFVHRLYYYLKVNLKLKFKK